MLYCPFRTCRLCSDPVNIMAPYSHFGALFRSVAYNLFRSTATGAHNPQPGRRRRDLTPQDQPHNPQHRGKHRLASTAQQPIPHQSRCAHRSGIHPIGGPHIRRHRSRGRVEDIFFRNIEILNGDFPVSIIRGFEMHTEMSRPQNIHFDNVVVLGKQINSPSDLHMVVELSNDIWFNGKVFVKRNPF